MPFSACTQRTSFPDPLSNIAGAKKPLRPAVVIRRARLLSALGSSCEDTLRQLASAEDLCAQLAPSDVRVPESDLAEADRRIAEAARTTGLKAFTRPARSLRLAASAALPLLDEALQAALPLQTSALSSATLPQARPKPSPSCAVILKLKLQTNGCLLKSALSPRSLPASQGFRGPPIAFPLPARLGAKPFWKAQGSFSPVEFGLL